MTYTSPAKLQDLDEYRPARFDSRPETRGLRPAGALVRPRMKKIAYRLLRQQRRSLRPTLRV